jgi:hypothetical protein
MLSIRHLRASITPGGRRRPLLGAGAALVIALTSAPTAVLATPVAVAPVAECLAIQGPIFDRPAPDSGPNWWVPVPRPTVTIGTVEMPSSAFSREVLGALQIWADLDICVWADVENVGGSRTITRLMQFTDGIKGRPAVDPEHLAAVDLTVLNLMPGPNDRTYLLAELLDDEDRSGQPIDAWSNKLKLTWLAQSAPAGWFSVGFDGAPADTSVSSTVQLFMAIHVLDLSADAITLESASDVPSAPVTFALPEGSRVDRRVVPGESGCVSLRANDDGTLEIRNNTMDPEECGLGFPELPQPTEQPSEDPTEEAPTTPIGVIPTLPPTDSGTSTPPAPTSAAWIALLILAGLAVVGIGSIRHRRIA